MGLIKNKGETTEEAQARLRAKLNGGPVETQPAGEVVEFTPAGGLSKSDPTGCPDPKHHYVVKYGVFMKGKLTESGAAKELNEMYAAGYVLDKMFTDPHDHLVKVFVHAGH